MVELALIPSVTSRLNKIGWSNLRDTLCLSFPSVNTRTLVKHCISPNIDCFLFRRAFLGKPNHRITECFKNLSENLIYKNTLIIVGNLPVFSKAKALFFSLSLIMFSEQYHGGLDEIRALCSRKLLHICTCFDRSHCSHTVPIWSLKLAKLQFASILYST